MMNPLKYPETEITPLVGDIVKFCGDSDTMIVEEVILGEEVRKGWGVKEDGIMMAGVQYGRIFDRLDMHSEVELVERPKTAKE